LNGGQFEKGHFMADDNVNKPTPDVLNDLPIDEDAVASKPQTDGAKPATDGEKPNATQTLKDGAAKLTQDVTDRARLYAEDGKARAGGALDELARMVSDAATQVDEKVGPQYGQYARTAADTITSLSDQIKAKEIDDLIEDARGFVAKSPAIAIGAAAAIGFVLARLVKSGLEPEAPVPTPATEQV
jgi:ElaB/YqjD/DUF883 family membrane-anchored ribosome-binding protein